jgi:hypothetical protein
VSCFGRRAQYLYTFVRQKWREFARPNWSGKRQNCCDRLTKRPWFGLVCCYASYGATGRDTCLGTATRNARSRFRMRHPIGADAAASFRGGLRRVYFPNNGARYFPVRLPFALATTSGPSTTPALTLRLRSGQACPGSSSLAAGP